MNLDRRNFLRTVAAAAAAGLVFDVDRALWVPGARKVFLPDTLVVPDCSACRFNLMQYRARDLYRVPSGWDANHLYSPRELCYSNKTVKGVGGFV